MRYHFGLLAPNSQMNRQPGSSLIQRSSPTCTLSLANVTASTASNDTLKDSDAMAVDPPLFSMTSLSTVGNDNIPFPTTGKRSHSLLRATAYCAQLTTAARPSDEACSTDPDPPRKRTRTSALPSSKTRFNRAISPPNHNFHSNRSASNSSLPPTTPKLLSASLKDASQLPSGVAQSNPLPASSHSPVINSPPLHDVPNATQLVLRPLVRPIQSPRWHHKRTAPSELRILISLHQVLVYGLALKYPIRKPDIASAADTTDDVDCEIFAPVFGYKAHRLFFSGSTAVRQRRRKRILVCTRCHPLTTPENASVSQWHRCISGGIPRVKFSGSTIGHPRGSSLSAARCVPNFPTSLLPQSFSCKSPR